MFAFFYNTFFAERLQEKLKFKDGQKSQKDKRIIYKTLHRNLNIEISNKS